VNTPAGDGSPGQAGYRRSAGSPRGEARRRELLDRVTDDLAVNGLVGFSLRRAARAAGTTHKVLLYHFDGADDLLRQAIFQLRERGIGKGLAAATQGPASRTLGDRVRAVWPILVGEEGPVLDQARPASETRSDHLEVHSRIRRNLAVTPGTNRSATAAGSTGHSCRNRGLKQTTPIGAVQNNPA